MEEKNNLIKFFHQSNLISLSGAEEISGYFERMVIPKNNFLLTNKIVCNRYYFLEEGFMRPFTFDINQEDVTTGFFSSKQLVFEVSSFFNRTISTENIQALTDCKGWYINYEQLNHFFHTIPEFRDFGRMVLVKGFASLKTRMLSMINQTAEERYAALLKTNPETFQYATLKSVASYLGVTDTSLSRIRKEFSKRE
jgi:CRP-like cAMP-binding protein